MIIAIFFAEIQIVIQFTKRRHKNVNCRKQFPSLIVKYGKQYPYFFKDFGYYSRLILRGVFVFAVSI